MGEVLANFYKKNIYKINHTFPGPGIYKIVVQDPNRNAEVKNIPNSVNVIFSISTILTVNPAMGHDNSPVLLNPPYDKAAYHIYLFIILPLSIPTGIVCPITSPFVPERMQDQLLVIHYLLQPERSE